MALSKLFNRAKMTVTGTPGTGTLTLNAAVTGYMSFATAGIADGDIVSYVIEDGAAWELGQGTYTAAGTTLARTTVIASSAGGTTKISATSAAQVYLTVLAADFNQAAALLGTTLAANVVTSSLTSFGTLTATINSTASTPLYGASSITNSPQVVLENQAADTSGPYCIFRKSRSAGPIQAGDIVGVFQWQAYDSGSVIRPGPYFYASCTAVAAGSFNASIGFLGADSYNFDNDLNLTSAAGGTQLTVGTKTTGSTTPTQIAFDNSYSTAAGANPKIQLFAGYGLGISAGSFDYMAAGALHTFYQSVQVIGDVTSTTGSIGGTEPGGRLTLTSATPVLTTTVSGATTVYYTPYKGDRAPFWSGTQWQWKSFTQVSQTTTDTTKSPAAAAASSCYDIFLWSDAGTIRATRGPAWTNITTRSAGTALTVVQGFYCNNAAITNGPAAGYGLYVGTIATNASSTVDYIFGASASGGTAAFLNVWNNFNRRLTATTVVDSGATYTYTTATTRAARASNANRITFVIGLSEDAVTTIYVQRIDTVAAVSFAQFAIGLDSTTAQASMFAFIRAPTAATHGASTVATYAAQIAIGQHYLQALDRGDGTNAQTYNTGSDARLLASIWN